MAASSRPTLRRLALTTVLAGGALTAMPAWGQVVDTNTPSLDRVNLGANVEIVANRDITAPINGSATRLDVNLADNRSTVITWNKFNVENGSTLAFTTNRTDNTAVLNRVANLGADFVSNLSGTIRTGSNIPGQASNVAVWLSNPNGIMVGPNAAINAGALVLTTLPFQSFPTDATNEVGRLPLSGGTGAGIEIAAGASIMTPGGPAVLVAPQINSYGLIAGRDVAFVVASDVTVYARPNTPLGITINAGVPVDTNSVIAGTARGQTIFVAGAAQVGVTSLLQIDGNLEARSTASGSIVIAAGPGPQTFPDGSPTPALTIRNLVGNRGNVDVTGSGNLRVASSGDAGSMVSITGRNVTLTGDITSPGNVIADTTGLLTLAGNVTARGYIDLTGNGGVTLGAADGSARSILANDDVDILSGGVLTGRAGLTVRSDADSSGGDDLSLTTTGAGSIAFAAGSLLSSGTLADVLVDTRSGGSMLQLGNVRANALTLTVSGGSAGRRAGDIVTGDLALQTAVNLESVRGNVTTGDIDLAAGLGVTLTAAGTVTAGAIDVDGPVTLTARGGGVIVDSATSAGAVSIDARGDVESRSGTGSSLIAGTDLTVDAGGTATIALARAVGVADLAARQLTVDVARADTLTLASLRGGAVTLGTGVATNAATIVADGDATITSLTSNTGAVSVTAGGTVGGPAGTGSRLIAATDLTVTAGGDAVIDRVRAGGTVTLDATNLTVDDARGATLALTSRRGGDLTLGVGRATGAATLTGADDVSIGDLGAGTALTVSAGDALTATMLTAGTLATVDAGGTASIDSISAPAIDVEAGTLTVGSANATQTTLDLTATTGALSLTTGSAGTDATLIARRGDLTVGTALTAGRVASGAATLSAVRGAVVAGAVTSRGDATTITGRSVQAGTVQAGTDLTITATAGNAALTAGIAQAAAITASGDVSIGTLETRGTGSGAISVTAGGAINATAVEARGTATTRSGGASTITTLTGNSGVDARGRSLALGTVTAGGGALLLQSTGGDLTLDTGSARGAATPATLTSAGALTIQNSLTATGAATLTAAGAVTGGTVRSVGAGVAVQGASVTLTGARAATGLTVEARSGALSLGTGLVLTGNATLTAAGDATVTALTARAGDVAVTSTTGTARIGSIEASGDIGVTARGAVTGTADRATLVAGGDVTVLAGTTARLGAVGGDNVTVEATDIDATLANARAGDLAFTADGGTITAGTLTASGAATLRASGDVTVDRVDAGTGAASLTTRGAAELGRITGNSVTVTAGSLIVGVADSDTTLALTTRAGPLSLMTGRAAGAATLNSADTLAVTDSLRAGAVTAQARGALTANQITGTDVTLRGASIDAAAVRATGALSATATAGSATIGTGTAGTTALLVARGGDAVVSGALTSGDTATVRTDQNARLANVISTGAGVAVSASGDVTGNGAGGANLTGAAAAPVSVTAGGQAVLGNVRGGTLNLTATGGPLVLANGNATTTATLRSGGNLDVTALTAGGAVTTRSGAATTIASVSGSDVSVTGGSVAITRVDATGALVAESTAGSATIGTGTAGTTALLAASGGDAVVTGTLTSAGTAAVRSNQNARLANVTSTGAGVAVTASGDVTGNGAGGANLTGAATAPVTVSAGGQAVLGAVRGGTLNLTATGGPLVLANGNATTTASLRSGGNLDVTALTAGGAVTTTSRAATTIASVSGSDVSVTGGSVAITRADATGALAAEANTGSATIGTGTAGTTARLTASGGDAIVSGTLEGVDAVTIVSDRNARLANVVVTGGAVPGAGIAVSASGNVTGNGAGGANLSAASAPVQVTARGQAVLGTVRGSTLDLTASGGPLVLASGDAATTATLRSGGDLNVTALTAGGAVTTSSALATSIGSVTGAAVTVTGGSVSVDNAAATTGALALASTGGPARIGTGRAATTASLSSAGGDAIVATRLEGGTGATITTIGGAARLATVRTLAGDLVVTSAGDLTGFGGDNRATLIAAGDLRVTASGNALLGAASAGGNMMLRAANLDATSLAITTPNLLRVVTAGALTVGSTASSGAVFYSAGGALTAGSVRSAGSAELRSGSALSVGTLNSGLQATVTATGPASLGTITSGGNLIVTGGGITLGAAEVTGTATLTSTAGVTSGTLNATGNVDITASGPATLTATRSGGVVNITSGGAGQLGAVAAATGLTVRGTGVQATSLTTAAGPLDVLSSGALTVGTASSGTTAQLVSSGPLSAGALTAGTTATLRSDSTLGIGTLATTGTATVTAAGAATLGTTTIGAGNLTVTAAGITAGTTSVAAGTATLTSSAGVISNTLTALGDVRIAAAGPVSLNATNAGRRAQPATGTTPAVTGVVSQLVVEGQNVAAGTVNVTGNAGVMSRGELAIAGQVDGTTTLSAVGTATLGQLTSGGALTLSATNAAVNGRQTAPSIEITNRNPGSQTLRIGNGLAAAGFQLSQAEMANLVTPSLTFNGGSGVIELGTLSLTDAAGSSALNFRTTGSVVVSGPVVGTNTSTRTVTIGGNGTGSGPTASKAAVIRLDTLPFNGGRLQFGTGTNLILNGTRIAQGQRALLDQLLGRQVSAEEAALEFTSDANSLLYNANPAGVPSNTGGLAVYQDTTALSAGNLTVNYDVFALFQNTGSAGRVSDLAPPTAGAVIANTLTIGGEGRSVPNTFALFGSVAGIMGQATAISTSVSTTGTVTVQNSRINGCLLGSGGGCLTTTLATPVLNVFDSSRLNVLSSVEDFSVPFDPVIGGNNEALFAGVSAIDVPITSTECDDGSTDPQCTGGSNQQETRP